MPNTNQSGVPLVVGSQSAIQLAVQQPEDIPVELGGAALIPVLDGDYNKLTNKPSLAGVTLQGDVTLEDIGLGNVDNTSDAEKKEAFTGEIAEDNTGFVTGGDVYSAVQELSGDISELDTTVGQHTTDIGNLQTDLSGKLDLAGGTMTGAIDMDGSAITNLPDGSNPQDAATVHNITSYPAIIPVVEVDSTSTSTAFTATVPNVTELVDGVAFFLTNGVVTSASNCTLNINGLGAKPIYQTMAAATRVSTTFNVAYTMLFVYNADRVSGGCWDMYYGYNANDNTIGYNIRNQQAVGKMKSALYRYQVMFTAADGSLIPANGVSNKPTTLTKTLTTEAFDPYAPIYYYSTTTTVSAGSVPGASYCWKQYGSADLRYAFNKGETLTSGNFVYLQCVPQSDGTFKLSGDNALVDTLPNTEDGYVYLRLGRAYSAYQCDLHLTHPLVHYKDGSIRPWLPYTMALDASTQTLNVTIN